MVHRAIATVGGATYCDFGELEEMAHLAREEKIEVIMTIGHRLGWDVGAKTAVTPEGQQNGWRHRGSDNVSYYLADLMRCVEAGFRGFLVYDEGVLLIVNEMRKKGFLPPETIFKVSVFAGYAFGNWPCWASCLVSARLVCRSVRIPGDSQRKGRVHASEGHMLLDAQENVQPCQ